MAINSKWIIDLSKRNDTTLRVSALAQTVHFGGGMADHFDRETGGQLTLWTGDHDQHNLHINELIVEKTTIDPMKETRLLKANCLLRNGSIRHFNVARIRSYRELPEEFIETFVAK